MELVEEMNVILGSIRGNFQAKSLAHCLAEVVFRKH